MTTRAQWRSSRLHFYDDVSLNLSEPVAPIVFEEDFFGASLVIPDHAAPESGCPWVSEIVGAGPPTTAIIQNGANGICECALEATPEAQSAEVYMNDQRQYSVVNHTAIGVYARLTVLPTLLAEIGWGMFGDLAAGYDNITFGGFFTADGSGAINCHTDDNVTPTEAASGVTVLATDWHAYHIDFADPTDVHFYIDGVRVAAATTFPYAATAGDAVLQPLFGGYKSGGAGVGTIKVDQFVIWSNRS